MVQIYNCMDVLSAKCDEELFHIYCGHPSQRPKEERYLAARILESRDFKFKEIGSYKQKWESEKWEHQSWSTRLLISMLGHQSKIISILLFIGLMVMLTFVISPFFIENGFHSFAFNGDIWFFLNILSFVIFFYIFGFIGYISRFISKLREKKRVFELHHHQTVWIWKKLFSPPITNTN